MTVAWSGGREPGHSPVPAGWLEGWERDPGPGIPIVDLTALLADTYERADAHRRAAVTLDRLAVGQRRTADHLESLADVLSGGGES